VDDIHYIVLKQEGNRAWLLYSVVYWWVPRIAKSVKRISRARYSKLRTRTLVTSPTSHGIKPK